MLTITVVASLLLMLAIGIASGRRATNRAESYFLGDRNLGRWVLAISAGAAANTGFVVIGAVGMGYSMGAASLLYPLAWFLGDLVFWYGFARPLNSLSRSSNAVTVSDLLATAAPGYFVRFVSATIIVVLLVVYASAQVIATDKSISSFYQLDGKWPVYATVAVVVLYTMWGGFRASVWTDVVQGLFMIGLPIGVLLWAVDHVGGIGPLFSALGNVGPEFLDLTGGRTEIALAAFVLGFAFAAFGFDLSQPQVTSRIMAGRNDAETRGARWIYIIFLQWTWAGMCLVGMVVRVIMPSLPDPEAALPALANQYFHPVFAGLVLASMFAAIQSSLSALLVAIGSALSIDIARLSKATALYYLSIPAAGVLSVFLAIYSEATVFQASLFAATILAASIGSAVVIVALGLRTDNVSLLAAMSVGVAAALAWRAFGLDAIISDALIGFIAAITVNTFSAATAPKSARRSEI